jgi:iron complex transport system permease protein
MMWLALALIAAFALSLFVGRYPGVVLLSPERLAGDELAQRLVLNLRLPRLLTAVMLGMSLAAAGSVFQMLFGNPLVEPGFLGVSQGAAFGAALSIVLLSNAAWLVQGMAARSHGGSWRAGNTRARTRPARSTPDSQTCHSWS